jgi:hypothetical protein
MPTETRNMKPTVVKFIQELKQSEYSTIFQVNFEGKECVMKVVSQAFTDICVILKH